MYEDYVIRDFKNAWFKKDYSKLSEEDFNIVYAEYQDTSGLFLTDDFERQSTIHHLVSRINYVKIFIRLQREFIIDFGSPFIRDFEHFKQEYGYVLRWENDLEDFEDQLKSVERRELKNESYLESKIKELREFREKNQKKERVVEDEDSLKKSRISFMRMINSLGKIGFNIDEDKTTVESLALMIKQQMEEVEEYNSKMNRY